jgi:hypothetical protein
MTKTSTYPLRLPVSLKVALEKLSKQDGISMNQFVVTAVAAKNFSPEYRDILR